MLSCASDRLLLPCLCHLRFAMQALSPGISKRWESVRIPPQLPELCSFWIDWCLQKHGLPKDVRQLILNFSNHNLFRQGTEPLRQERLDCMLAFNQNAPLSKVLECLRQTTRLLHLPDGYFYPAKIKSPVRWLTTTDHCVDCPHSGIWARVRKLPSFWPQKLSCNRDLESKCQGPLSSWLLQ